MTITHHPSDETLLRCAAGRHSAGPALVVEVHLEGCAHCRRRRAEFERLGGILLDEAEPEPLAPDALARCLGALERPAVVARRPQPASRPIQIADGLATPVALRHCEVGPWRRLGPGFRWSRVNIPGRSEARVALLRAQAGGKLPRHGHAGTEFLQVLCGALSDARGRYVPGDLDEIDSDVDHCPVIGPQAECICLVALEGDVVMHGALGRLLWPIIGF